MIYIYNKVIMVEDLHVYVTIPHMSDVYYNIYYDMRIELI